MLIQKQLLLKFTIQLLFSWLFLSVVFYIWGVQLIIWLLPYFDIVNEMLAPAYSSILSIESTDQGDVIQLTANVVSKIYLSNETIIYPGARMTSSSNIIHSLVPIVILFSLLMSWPVKSWLNRLGLLLPGIPLILLILGITTPVLLAGKLEMMLIEHAATAGISRPESFMVTWMIFTESGGRWLLPVAAAILSLYIVNNVPTYKAFYNNNGEEVALFK